ncbi:predicted protein [Uncinocarpus reesii 1704]|uniref:Uncharacterized protein n=1 Tax=Uncinocarpus reesii (strain UAMH 1704) TaxID=336963 RepID=C4JPH9_UNCRE|nr:uncharacterized protein UREG_03151 [Uncinocarpus reesii 1704]EEP78305.1 predicted protein [Uncinocarpus reesii 1704]
MGSERDSGKKQKKSKITKRAKNQQGKTEKKKIGTHRPGSRELGKWHVFLQSLGYRVVLTWAMLVI